MNGLQLYQSLGGIGIEQLPGIAIASTLLSACGLFVMFVLRRQSASARFCIWQAACGAIVLSTVVLAVSPGIPLRRAAVEGRAEVASIRRTDSYFVATEPLVVTPAESVQASVSNIVATESPKVPNPIQKVPSQAVIVASADQPSHQRFAGTSAIALFANLPALLAGIWLVVLGLKVLSFGGSVATCYAIVRRASREVWPAADSAFDAARQRLGLTCSPLLVVSDEVAVPFTLGIARPVVVLPGVAKAWSTDKLEMVIAHELAHIERGDLLWHWIGKLAVCITWFNPLV